MNSRQLGKEAEEIALRELESMGYSLLDRNWQFGHKELDLVMMDRQELVIVEVKSLRSITYGQPIDHVNRRKERNIIDAADAYIIQKDLSHPVRFDVVEVVFSGNEHAVNHIPNAFGPQF
jgi:putative endonuclease